MSLSSKYYQKARDIIPGGVNSPVRAFNGVDSEPLFIKRGYGPYLYDVDDNQYIDYVGSWGPLILGHAHPTVLQAIKETIDNGLSFGAPCVQEIELAELIVKYVDSIEQVRMVSSGTEAAMSALRLARGVTKKDKIIKFIGCYHGHSDALLVEAGSGVLTFGVPSSAGVPASTVEHTLVAPFNDLEAVKKLFLTYGNDIAAVIVEPIAANMNLVPATDSFLKGLRDLCTSHRSMLIFDEVITGFRVGLGGAQAHYNVTPDLTVLGKIIGGGLPVGAFGGERAIMEHLAPVGPVYQAGTLSGNPIVMSAGIATLKLVASVGFYDDIQSKCNKLTAGLLTAAKDANIPICINQIGGMFGLFFKDETPIFNLDDVNQSNIDRFKQFHRGMINEGVYLAPSMYEIGFISNAHDDSVIDRTLISAAKVLNSLEA